MKCDNKILEWMVNASEGDTFNLPDDFDDISHTEVVDLCDRINLICEFEGSDKRIRKSWKAVELMRV